MISGPSTSLSGVSASQMKLNSTAHNLANANTDGFTQTRAVLDESRAGGVQVRLELVDHVDGLERVRIAEANQKLTVVEQSNVDLGEELVDLLTTRRFFEINLRALDTQEQAIGTLLDVHN